MNPVKPLHKANFAPILSAEIAITYTGTTVSFYSFDEVMTGLSLGLKCARRTFEKIKPEELLLSRNGELMVWYRLSAELLVGVGVTPKMRQSIMLPLGTPMYYHGHSFIS